MKHKKRLHKGFHVIPILTLLIFALFFPSQNITNAFEIRQYEIKSSPYSFFVPEKYPIDQLKIDPPEISAQSAMVLDVKSGAVLYSKNAQRKLRPASITKLMTAIVAMDAYNLDQILEVKRLAPVPFESDMGLVMGDKVSVRNLIYGLLLPSGNDAAYTLADNYPYGFEQFLYAMNMKAKNLNMLATHFENPSGFDGLNHYTTAYDLSLLSRAVLLNPFLSKVVSTYSLNVFDVTQTRVYRLINVNQFLGYLYGADGVKTGTTDLAGQCLVASVTRDNNQIISVVLRSEDRFADSARLLEWAFRNFAWKNFQYESNN